MERLQEDLDKVHGEISSFMLLVEGLTRNDFVISAEDYDDVPYPIDQNHEIVSVGVFLFFFFNISFC